jgi:2-keto-4-pentenoate hydratase/2-oxohepta-3-ene-1,7-dioic acid hydratase in catechol pathway
MRFCTFERNGTVAVGIERDGAVYPSGYSDMLALIRDGVAGTARATEEANRSSPVAVDRFLTPLLRPGTIYGSGINYKTHGDDEPAIAYRSEPRIDFITTPNAVIGPDADIVIPPHDRVIKRPSGFNVDYEAELGVVIGATAKNVSRDEALEYVVSYAVFNDVGSRAVQF